MKRNNGTTTCTLPELNLHPRLHTFVPHMQMLWFENDLKKPPPLKSTLKLVPQLPQQRYNLQGWGIFSAKIKSFK